MVFSSGAFDKLLEKATSSLLLDPDWDATLQICDSIRAGDVTTKYAANALTKKILDKNEHVARFALDVLESCVKNCGGKFHEEIFTRQFLDDLHELANKESLKPKICALIQAWDRAFKDNSKFRVIHDKFNIMKHGGFQFPEHMKESDYMFVSESAPAWSTDNNCFRCRTTFSVMTRQHHCRNCGQAFCNKCSSKSCSIPKFGIEKEVRVCESCFEKLNKSYISANSTGSSSSSDSVGAGSALKTDDEVMAAYLASDLAKEAQVPQKPANEDQLKEEEELQLALAISQSEAEASESTRGRSKTTPTHSEIERRPEEEPNSELARYLDRSYWEQMSRKSEVAAPPPHVENHTKFEEPALNADYPERTGSVSNGYNEEQQAVTSAIEHQLEIFLNRMRSNMSRGRNITQDSSVQSLYQSLANLHPQLAKLIAGNENNRSYYEGLQDQLSQLKDAREALDAMREDYQEKLRLERQEKERQLMLERQQKLEALRNLKHQFLLRRMQQLETQRQTEINNQQFQYQMYSQGYPPQMGSMYGQPPADQYMSNPAMMGYPGQYPGAPVPQNNYMPPPGQSFNMQAIQGSLPPSQNMGYPQNGQYYQTPDSMASNMQQTSYQQQMPPEKGMNHPPGYYDQSGMQQYYQQPGVPQQISGDFGQGQMRPPGPPEPPQVGAAYTQPPPPQQQQLAGDNPSMAAGNAPPNYQYYAQPPTAQVQANPPQNAPPKPNPLDEPLINLG